MQHLNRSHCCSRCVGEQARHSGVGHERDIRQVHDLADAVDVGVRLGMNEAGVPIAGIAAHALGSKRVGLIALQPERNGKRVDAELADIVLDALHARFI